MRGTSTLILTVRIGGPDGRLVTANGREAWALECLMKAGERGCTPIDHPGPRWSGYVLDLRGMGVSIETVREKHGGKFAGSHARYVLRSPCEVIERIENGRSAAASGGQFTPIGTVAGQIAGGAA